MVTRSLAGADARHILDLAVSSIADAEPRPQQVQMCGEVADALATGQSLLCQAGTGTGKTLALLAAAVTSGKRVAIATATKALGQQVTTVDIPCLVEAVTAAGYKAPTVALLKGRSSYVCLSRLEESVALGSRADDAGDGLFDVPSVANVHPDTNPRITTFMQWAQKTATGDRADAPPVPSHVWSSVSTDAAGCSGAKCVAYQRCHAENARRAARQSDIVVTSHAMLAIELGSDQGLLGDVDAFIVDEAHEFSRYCSSAWGVTVAAAALTDAVAAVKRLRAAGAQIPDGVEDAIVGDVLALESVCSELPAGRLLELPGPLESVLASLSDRFAATARACAALLDVQDAPDQGLVTAAGIVTDRADDVAGFLASDGTQWVRWVDVNAGPGSLRAAPLQVGPLLTQNRDQRALIAVSATLAVGGNFRGTAAELGIPGARCVDVGTPFDYRKQMLLHVPGPEFPAPVGKDRTEHFAAVVDRLITLVAAADGRTLALFTTSAGAERAAELLRAAAPPGVNVIGHTDGPAESLTAQFAADERSVLVGTAGFWAGLSVPGPSCVCVVIEKIPFPPFTDVLNAARMDAAGSSGFTDVCVHHAALMLAQGAGRLIRTGSDRGVLAVLDPRLLTKGYGPALLASLPNAPRNSDVQVAVAGLRRLAAERAGVNIPTGAPVKRRPAGTGGRVTAGTTVRSRKKGSGLVAVTAVKARGTR